MTWDDVKPEEIKMAPEEPEHDCKTCPKVDKCLIRTEGMLSGVSMVLAMVMSGVTPVTALLEMGNKATKIHARALAELERRRRLSGEDRELEKLPEEVFAKA